MHDLCSIYSGSREAEQGKYIPQWRRRNLLVDMVNRSVALHRPKRKKNCEGFSCDIRSLLQPLLNRTEGLRSFPCLTHVPYIQDPTIPVSDCLIPPHTVSGLQPIDKPSPTAHQHYQLHPPLSHYPSVEHHYGIRFESSPPG